MTENTNSDENREKEELSLFLSKGLDEEGGKDRGREAKKQEEIWLFSHLFSVPYTFILVLSVLFSFNKAQSI